MLLPLGFTGDTCFSEESIKRVPNSGVNGQMLYPHLEAFLAMLTLITFLFGMSSDVIFEAIFPGKIFLAILTLTWFLE